MLAERGSTKPGQPGKRGQSRGLAWDIFETFVTRAARLVIMFVASVVITRALGAEGRGAYQLLNVTAEIAGMLASGGITRSLIFYLAGENRERFLPVFCTHFVVRMLLLGALLPLIIFLPFDVFVPMQTPGRVALLVLMAWALCVEGWVGSLLRAVLRFGAANRSQLQASIGRVLCLLGLAATGTASVATVALARITTLFAMIPVAWTTMRELQLRPRLGWDAGANRLVSTYGTLFFVTLLFQNLHYKADIYLLQHWGSVHDVGVYTAGTQLVQMLWMLPTAVQTVLLPSSVGGDLLQRARAIAAASRTMGCVMTCAALGIALSAPVVLPLLYGPEFNESATVTRLLAPGIAANAFHQMSAVFLASQGHVGKLALIGPAGFVLNLAANCYAIPAYGINGAAAVSSFSYTSTALLATYMFCKAAGLSMSEALLVRSTDLARLAQLLRRRKHGGGAP